MDPIKKDNKGDHLLLTISGKMDIDFVQSQKENCLKACEETRNLIMDFSHVDYIDSSGLGFLVTMRKAMENKGGTLILRNVPQVVRQLLTLTRMTTSFEIQ